MSGIFKKTSPDPFGKMTDSMRQFEAGITNWYVSKDGFKHELTHPRFVPGGNRMTTSCLFCDANRNDAYEEKHTADNELIAMEVAQWQMNHREGCKAPLSVIEN